MGGGDAGIDGSPYLVGDGAAAQLGDEPQLGVDGFVDADCKGLVVLFSLLFGIGHALEGLCLCLLIVHRRMPPFN